MTGWPLKFCLKKMQRSPEHCFPCPCASISWNWKSRRGHPSIFFLPPPGLVLGSYWAWKSRRSHPSIFFLVPSGLVLGLYWLILGCVQIYVQHGTAAAATQHGMETETAKIKVAKLGALRIINITTNQ